MELVTLNVTNALCVHKIFSSSANDDVPVLCRSVKLMKIAFLVGCGGMKFICQFHCD